MSSHTSNEGTKVTSRAPVRRWHGLANEWLTGALGEFLDYGCGACEFATRVADRCNKYHGVDVDGERIAGAQARYAEFKLSVIEFDGKTPYEDDYFDTAAIVEVIEHVTDERVALAELARVLKPGGRLILTTPHRGLFTFLDSGNFKFAFPRLHKFVHVWMRGERDYYENRFGQQSTRGMVGDIATSPAREPWHRHYKAQEIIDLCPPELVCERYGVFFPGMRGLMLLRVVVSVCTMGRVTRLLWPFSLLERRLSRLESRFGDQLIMLLRKTGPN